MSPLEKLFGKTAQLTVLEYLMKNKGELNYHQSFALLFSTLQFILHQFALRYEIFKPKKQ